MNPGQEDHSDDCTSLKEMKISEDHAKLHGRRPPKNKREMESATRAVAFFFPLQMAHHSLLFPGKNPFFLVMKMPLNNGTRMLFNRYARLRLSACLFVCLPVNDGGKRGGGSISIRRSIVFPIVSPSCVLSLRRLDAQHMKPIDRPFSCIGLLPKWSLPLWTN